MDRLFRSVAATASRGRPREGVRKKEGKSRGSGSEGERVSERERRSACSDMKTEGGIGGMEGASDGKKVISRGRGKWRGSTSLSPSLFPSGGRDKSRYILTVVFPRGQVGSAQVSLHQRPHLAA